MERRVEQRIRHADAGRGGLHQHGGRLRLGRNADKLTEGQDVYSAIVQHEALGSGSDDAIRYAVASMAGLAVVGIVLFGVSIITGRRRPQVASATEPAASKGRVTS